MQYLRAAVAINSVALYAAKMNIKRWLAQADKLERLRVAAEAKTTVAYLWQLAGGHRQCSAEMATMLHRATRGTINRRELRPDLFGAGATTSRDAKTG